MTPCAYLAGPMRGLPGFNFDAFDQAAAALRALGWTVHSPAEHDRSMGFDPSLGTLEGFDVAAAMSWDLQQVLDMECVIVLPGWAASTGCHYELSACHALGKPVYQYPELTPVELPKVITDPVKVQQFNGTLPPTDTPTVAQRTVTRDDIEASLDKKGVMRTFGTGATRSSDADKLDYEGFLSPYALEEYAKYLHKNRVQADGNMRDSDNWQKGIPKSAYMKSMFRHFLAAWRAHREGGDPTEDLCAVLFNAMGFLHEGHKP